MDDRSYIYPAKLFSYEGRENESFKAVEGRSVTFDLGTRDRAFERVDQRDSNVPRVLSGRQFALSLGFPAAFGERGHPLAPDFTQCASGRSECDGRLRAHVLLEGAALHRWPLGVDRCQQLLRAGRRGCDQHLRHSVWRRPCDRRGRSRGDPLDARVRARGNRSAMAFSHTRAKRMTSERKRAARGYTSCPRFERGSRWDG